MDREFLVKVIAGEKFIPVVIRANNAAAALQSFAERQSASIVEALHADGSSASATVGVEERSYRVVVSPRI